MAASHADRRLTAVLAADVVGYSGLMERDEDRTVARLKAHRKEFIEPLDRRASRPHRQLIGDGPLCEFASVVDAVRCAVLFQQGMAERERDVAGAGSHPLPHRHQSRRHHPRGRWRPLRRRRERRRPPRAAGRARRRAGFRHRLRPPAGQARPAARVHRASSGSRTSSGRYGPTACVSTAHRRAPAPRIHPRRRWPLAVARACRVSAQLGAWWLWRGTGRAARQSLDCGAAVRERQRRSRADEYLADGITDDLITDLAQLSGLMVIGRNSVFGYKDRLES